MSLDTFFSFLFVMDLWPLCHILNNIWISFYIQNVIVTLLIGYLGESAEAILWGIFSSYAIYPNDTAGKEDTLDSLLGDILNNTIGCVMIGLTSRMILSTPYLLPPFKLVYYKKWLKYILQMISLPVIAFFISVEIEVTGLGVMHLGRLIYFLSGLLLPWIYYLWNRKDQSRQIPSALYVRSYMALSATNGLYNIIFFSKFSWTYFMGYTTSIIVFSIYVILYHIITKEDMRRYSNILLPIKNTLFAYLFL